MIKIKSIVRKILPRPLLRRVLQFWKPIRERLNKRKYAGDKYYCPICQNQVITFLPAGKPLRPLARCPVCNSLERHRLDWIFFREKTDLFDQNSKKMLHVAPEPFFASRLKHIANLDYVTGDLNDPRAMVTMNITNIDFPDNYFDIIYCSHVLEHITNDHKAIQELFRVCKPGGWALLQVPITAEKTFEDCTIKSPEDREKVFGQKDHVRRCGPDYIERMRKGGFKVTLFSTLDIIKPDDCIRLGVQQNRLLFFCLKLIHRTNLSTGC